MSQRTSRYYSDVTIYSSVLCHSPLHLARTLSKTSLLGAICTGTKGSRRSLPWLITCSRKATTGRRSARSHRPRGGSLSTRFCFTKAENKQIIHKYQIMSKWSNSNEPGTKHRASKCACVRMYVIPCCVVCAWLIGCYSHLLHLDHSAVFGFKFISILHSRALFLWLFLFIFD